MATPAPLLIRNPSFLEGKTVASSTASSPSPRRVVYRKIAIVGGRSVGKSAIVYYCINGQKSKTKDPSPSVEYSHKICFTLSKYPKAVFNCSIVDTPGFYGTDRAPLSRNVMIGVDCYMFVFSVTSRASFEQVKEINKALMDALGDPPDVPCVLVGTMIDKNERSSLFKLLIILYFTFMNVSFQNIRMVSKEQAKALAAEWGVMYMETSGETGESISNYMPLDFIASFNQH